MLLPLVLNRYVLHDAHCSAVDAPAIPLLSTPLLAPLEPATVTASVTGTDVLGACSDTLTLDAFGSSGTIP